VQAEHMERQKQDTCNPHLFSKAQFPHFLLLVMKFYVKTLHSSLLC